MGPLTDEPRTLSAEGVTPESLQVGRMFISTLPATKVEGRWAFALVCLFALIFGLLLPRAATPSAQLQVFVPVYETGLVVIELTTGFLVFAQWIGLRSRSLYVLSCGYFFVAFMGVAYATTFFAPLPVASWLAGGPQTAPWLYMFRRALFPFFVVGYALMRGRDGRMQRPANAPLGFLSVVVLVLFASVVLVSVAILGGAHLPSLAPTGSRTSVAMVGVVTLVWGASFVALISLWRRRPNSVLDLWLMVAMVASIFDIALSGLSETGRFDVGFYAGRIYGFLAESVVLVALLVENAAIHAQLVKVSSDLVQLSSTDQLTGVANRRVFESAIFREWRRAIRHEAPLSLVMIDVDHFKGYNDQYGHVAGDNCLRQIARVLQKTTRRATDLVARYGGEEFAVLLPNTTVPEAHRLAQQMCDAVGRLDIPHKRSPIGHVTISAGVACVRISHESELRLVTTHRGKELTMDTLTTPVTIVQAADHALYTAKQTGRSRVSDFSLDVPAPYDWGHNPTSGAAKKTV